MKNFIDQLLKYLIIPNMILIIIYYIDIYSLFGGFQAILYKSRGC